MSKYTEEFDSVICHGCVDEFHCEHFCHGKCKELKDELKSEIYNLLMFKEQMKKMI